ncbi:hypothetical protein PALB_35930 [Pseudoalteromonas luteoviolacea B = ATCC 29581]|nr:hypothetical protein PALB_35930 [Pseudoalteromonas luteoviolacea B = ATCC 29581]
MQTPEEYEITERIRELLKELKQKRGYTKKTISQKLGIGLTTLDDYLNGVSSFRLGVLLKLSELCKVKLGDILDVTVKVTTEFDEAVKNGKQKKANENVDWSKD